MNYFALKILKKAGCARQGWPIPPSGGRAQADGPENRHGWRVFGGCALVFLLMTANAFGQTGRAPDFTLKDLEGKDFSLSSLKGKVVILDFWAVYCPPCREEIPSFINLYETYKEKGLEVIGVTVDREASKVKAFMETNKISYPILFSSKEILEAYGGIQAIPTTFIIDRNLNIINKHVGFAEKSYFEDKIKPLLNATESVEVASSADSLNQPENK